MAEVLIDLTGLGMGMDGAWREACSVLLSFLFLLSNFQSDLKDVGSICLHDDLMKGKKNCVSFHL